MMAIQSPRHDTIPHSHVGANVHNDSRSDPPHGMENTVCPGCKKSAVDENGGLVVAFGQSFFHVDCFKCAKCGDRVTADTNLLLLSDGSPICANCSYSCNVCGLPILDEAIMTGDDSYHAHCFKCKVCKNRIDELVFAKTSQGIYCMNCHSERMAKMRKHAQKKKEKERAAKGSGSSRSREHEANEFHRHNDNNNNVLHLTSAHSDTSMSTIQPPSTPRTPYVEPHPMSASPRMEKRKSIPRFDTSRHNGSRPSTPDRLGQYRSPSDMTTSSSRPVFTPSVTVAPPSDSINRNGDNNTSSPGSPRVVVHQLPAEMPPSSSSTSLDYLRSSPQKLDTLPLPSSTEDGSSIMQRSKSFDDGVRPLQILSNQLMAGSVNNTRDFSAGVQGLQIPNKSTSRSEKRRSINPGLVLADFNSTLNSSAGANSSSFHPPSNLSDRSHTSAVHERTSPVAPSPLREQFVDASKSRRISGSSSLHEHSASTTGTFFTSVSSPISTEKDEFAKRQRSASSSTYLPERTSTEEPADPLRPPLRPSVTSERVPPRIHSFVKADMPSTSGNRDRLSPSPNGSTLRMQRSFDDRARASSPRSEESRRFSSNSSLGKKGASSRSNSGSRPTSPGYRADVPHGIESGTDTDAEGEESSREASVNEHHNEMPPLPPPKEGKEGKQKRHRPQDLKLFIDSSNNPTDPDTSNVSQVSSAESEDTSESYPVERTSMSTFIAPALPPIRFSMAGADFSDLLKSVGGLPSLKSLDQLAKLTEQGNVPTPPPSASPYSSDALSPLSEATPLEDDEPTVKRVDPPAHIIPMARSKTEGHAPGTSLSTFASQATLTAKLKTEDTAIPSSRKVSLDETSSRSTLVADSVDLPAPIGRSSSDSQYAPSLRSTNSLRKRERLDSNASTNFTGSSSSHLSAQASLLPPGGSVGKTLKHDTSELVIRRLQEALTDASDRGAQQLKLDKGFVEVILMVMEQRRQEYTDLRGKLDGIKRASKQYMDGLTVAQTEYDRELKARRDAEAEVTRLRVLLSGQALRLSAISGEARRQETREQLSQEMDANLAGLERDLSKLKVDRDMALAEVEELSALKSSSSPTGGSEISGSTLSRSLTMRLDNIKSHYQHELVPLTQQREVLARETTELKAIRDILLEETTALSARNEELAQLSAQYARRIENATASRATSKELPSLQEDPIREKQPHNFEKSLPQPHRAMVTNSLSSSSSGSHTLFEDADSKLNKTSRLEAFDSPSQQATPRPPKFIKWPGSKTREQLRDPINSMVVPDNNKVKSRLEHTFQQLSVLRFTRCDHCGDKMWGSQLRCSSCNISVHVRCNNHVQISCSHSTTNREEPIAQIIPLPPSMFGRDLTEQLRADSVMGEREVPVIVEKCIEAVETLALDYEGIYRKTGGSGQSKVITQLFERGDYDAFDLRDTDRFNDICSVTSVLKTYFRSLPTPLLTYDLHDDFMTAAEIKDTVLKTEALWDLVNKLPDEHYATLRMLMLHLHRVHEHNEKNLMNARNLGVVFGPTLMRSRDPSAEFNDMAGKALSVEWLVQNANLVFHQDRAPH